MLFDISQPIADVVDLFGHTTQVRKLTVEQIKTPVYLGKLGMQGTDVSGGFGAERVQLKTKLGEVRPGRHTLFDDSNIVGKTLEAGTMATKLSASDRTC